MSLSGPPLSPPHTEYDLLAFLFFYCSPHSYDRSGTFSHNAFIINLTPSYARAVFALRSPNIYAKLLLVESVGSVYIVSPFSTPSARSRSPVWPGRNLSRLSRGRVRDVFNTWHTHKRVFFIFKFFFFYRFFLHFLTRVVVSPRSVSSRTAATPRRTRLLLLFSTQWESRCSGPFFLIFLFNLDHDDDSLSDSIRRYVILFYLS